MGNMGIRTVWSRPGHKLSMSSVIPSSKKRRRSQQSTEEGVAWVATKAHFKHSKNITSFSYFLISPTKGCGERKKEGGEP
jgi:hypothetical protein